MERWKIRRQKFYKIMIGKNPSIPSSLHDIRETHAFGTTAV